MPTLRDMSETCGICGCRVHREGHYAEPSVEGRSHATRHHFVAERFFGRSTNRAGDQRQPVFAVDPWGVERQTAVFCYECHEELLHNPVLLPEDIEGLQELVRRRGLSESEKAEDRVKLAGRIKLLHDVLQRGIQELRRDAGA